MSGVKQTLAIYWAFLRRRRGFLGGSLAEYLAVAIVFFVLTGFYTDWIIFRLSSHMFIQQIGDGTAGFLWLNFADHDLNPLLGHTTMVNYPMGDGLGGASFIVYSALWVPMWILARLTSSMTALNLVTLWGFFSGAFAMYWLVKKLFDNIPIAFLSGFAAAFVPYKIINSSSHLAYIFSVVFVLIVAAFIGLWRRQTKWRALLLAVTLALAFYTDGYFILLGTVLVCCLCLGGVVYGLISRYNKQEFWRRGKYLLMAAAAFLVFCAPLVYTQLSSNKVNAELSSARKPIADELPYYAAKRIDFLAPPLGNPFFKNMKSYQNAQAKKSDHSNYAENTLYIGYTLILLCVLGAIIFGLSFVRRNGKRFLSNIDDAARDKALFIACLAIAPLPFMLAFMVKPYVHIFGMRLDMPSGLLIDLHISLWRVMTRFFVPLQMLIVLCSALSLWLIFTQWFAHRARYIWWILVAVLTVLLAGEYATTINRPGFDLHQVPPAYTWLSKQKDITAVAELPLVDRPFSVTYPYIAAQMIHGKKLVNSQLITQPAGSRNALDAVTNPDTIDFVVARGAQAIILHDKVCAQQPWGTLAHQSAGWPEVLVGKNNSELRICIYTNIHSITHDLQFAHVLDGSGVDAPIIYGNVFYDQFYGNYLKLGIFDQKDQPITEHGRSTFSTSLKATFMHTPMQGTWRVLQHNKVVSSGVFDTAHGQTPITAQIDPAVPVEMRFGDLQGNDPQPYQLSLGDVTVTAQ